MKLLIITQVIDTEHPILGFFHRWVEEFAKHCEQVHVICLEEGKHQLPKNVHVYSLGKEEGKGRLIYVIRFYKLIWQLRHEYDNVFVHMNQIYVILGAPLWRAIGKKIGLWYMHGAVTTSLRIAEKLTNHIFTGSPESCRLASSKIKVTGHGIDTDRFAPQAVTKDLDLITVGRITESKNLLTLVDILHEVRKTHAVTLTIVGGAIVEGERGYEERLRHYIKEHNLTDVIHFMGKVPQAKLPAILNRAKVFVTVAQNGSLDKAVLEAMACGLPVVSMAPGSVSLSLDTQASDKDGCVVLISKILQFKSTVNQNGPDYIRRNHSIRSLVPRIIVSLDF